MADSTASTACALCGGPLDEHDLDRGTCHDCRSPKGKITDLDVAIRASGDNPKRIRDWPVIRHLLRKRFGEDRSEIELWERCIDWLHAEGGLTPNEYLAQPLNYLQRLLENGFTRSDEMPATIEDGEHLARTVEIPAETIKTGNLTKPNKGKRRPAADTETAEPVADEQPKPATGLLSVFTNGLADERFKQAENVLNDDQLAADEKLWKIDALIRIPPTASAAKLGEVLGVSKSAVQKTTWYIQNRKGQKDNEIGRRHEQHRRRGQQYEPDRKGDDDN